MKLEGLYTAMITPFIHDKVDENGLVELIHEQLAAQVEGMVFLGTTAESPTLTDKEKKRIIEIAVSEIQGAAQVIIGTGTNCTLSTIEKTIEAENLGADMALLICPYYNCPNQLGLYNHFEAILKATELPVILYNHPKRTGVNLEASTALKLAKHEKVLGLKEANMNSVHLQTLFETFEHFQEEFSILGGCDEKVLPLMQHGGKGLISVISNAFPKMMKNLIQLLNKGEFIEGEILFEKYLPLIDFCSIETNPVPIKALMSEMALPSGKPRLPLAPLAQKNRTLLKKRLKETTSDLLCRS